MSLIEANKVIYVDDNNDNCKELLKQIDVLRHDIERMHDMLADVCDDAVECNYDNLKDILNYADAFEKLASEMNHVLRKVQSERLKKLHDESCNWNDVL